MIFKGTLQNQYLNPSQTKLTPLNSTGAQVYNKYGLLHTAFSHFVWMDAYVEEAFMN